MSGGEDEEPWTDSEDEGASEVVYETLQDDESLQDETTATAGEGLDCEQLGAIRAFLEVAEGKEEASGVVHAEELHPELRTAPVEGQEAEFMEAARHMSVEFEAKLVASAREGLGARQEEEEEESTDELEEFFGAAAAAPAAAETSWADAPLSDVVTERIQAGVKGWGMSEAEDRAEERAKYELMVQHLLTSGANLPNAKPNK
eukprot:TRINITY_DN5830_c0_g2_i1.p2 TRINITY_DN5830_c0_g2~~TRINITY_DN5830_c0_g2_i1.p2  ORF type:complete len:203 (-),score=78.72 TRINITY_DN5830_c0_g2_i1:93-701(-)